VGTLEEEELLQLNVQQLEYRYAALLAFASNACLLQIFSCCSKYVVHHGADIA